MMSMRFGFATILLAIALLSSCTSEKPAVPTSQSEQAGASPNETKTEDDGCVRGEPSSILTSGSEFVSRDSREAIETITDSAIPRLVIRHYGCAHYALDFTFTWPEPSSRTRQTALREAAARIASFRSSQETTPTLQRVRDGLLKLAEDPATESISLGETETMGVAAPAPNTIVITYDVAL